MARNVTGSADDGRTAPGNGYAMSPKRREMIKEAFGWIKDRRWSAQDAAKWTEKAIGTGAFCISGLQPDQTVEAEAAGACIMTIQSAAWRASQCKGERALNQERRRTSGVGKMNERP